jgi:hypothetical protein
VLLIRHFEVIVPYSIAAVEQSGHILYMPEDIQGAIDIARIALSTTVSTGRIVA